MAGGQKTSLSKNVLQMKFMQRSALRIEKEQSAEERQRDIDDEHWVLDLPATQKLENKYIIEPSIARIENLRYGRFSYNGFNPEVEKLMKQHETEDSLRTAEEREKEISVNDEEMANRYESLVGTISKKFAQKRQRSKVTEDSSDENSDSDSDTNSKVKGAKNSKHKPEVTQVPQHKKQKRKFMKPSGD